MLPLQTGTGRRRAFHRSDPHRQGAGSNKRAAKESHRKEKTRKGARQRSGEVREERVMRVVAVLCSPYRGGNSDTLAEAFASAMPTESVERVVVSDLHVEPCRSCRACNTTGSCVLDDDAAKVYERLLAADVVVVATPCHMCGFPSAAQALLERAQFLWARRYLLKRPPHTSTNSRIHRKLFAIITGGQKAEWVIDGMVRTLKTWGCLIGAPLCAVMFAGGLHEHSDATGDTRLRRHVALLAASVFPPTLYKTVTPQTPLKGIQS
ncbi:MAG: hypothetical protein DRP82_04375 [Planctomycetota bacterium]|nr:MAG: hypothetical protein DRP82_04375 [Planctomycetota bacterium]